MRHEVEVTVQNLSTKETRRGKVTLKPDDWELLNAAARIGSMTAEELLSRLLSVQLTLQFLAGLATRSGIPVEDVDERFARIVADCLPQVATFLPRQ